MSRTYVLLFVALQSCAPARAPDEQIYLPARHNWAFRARHGAVDRLFNAFDYGHAVLSETLVRNPAAPTATLDEQELTKIIGRILPDPPRFPLETRAIAPDWSRLAPEIESAFEWAHVLHRQSYDVLVDERLSSAAKDAEIAALLRHYRSRRDMALSAMPKNMHAMEGQPYSLSFKRRFPAFNGLIWSYHWLQLGIYDALLLPAPGRVDAVAARFNAMLERPPMAMPSVMPMAAAVAPRFAAKYPELAIIFDNLHALHDVVSDILASDTVPRSGKRAALLAALARYQDDTTDVTTRAEWAAMSAAMGVERMGGVAVP